MKENGKVLWPGWETGPIIGRGSFGEVYEIHRDVFGTPEQAALKVITIPQNASDIDEMYNDGYDEESITSTFKNHLESIVAEYTLMRKMNGSANIVNCDDIRYVQHDNGIGWDIFIKMELLTPLGKALPADISEEQVIRVAMDMCAALELCSQHHIVHRDIKPQNIFVSANGDYKLGDFGIAKTVERTMGGTKIGTYKYMAPEVYNNQPYGTGADIYSLGLVLYWLLNERRMPFLPPPPAKLTMGMEEQARNRRLFGEPLQPPAHGSERLKAIVLKACAYAPKDRYASAEEMLTDLQHLSGAAVSALAVNPTQNSLAAEETELPEEATVGPGFSWNVLPAEEEQDKTEGPTFDRHNVVPAEELDKTVMHQFAAKAQPEKKPVKKNKIGLTAAVVLVLVGLYSVFFSPWNPKPKDTLMEDSYQESTLGDLPTEIVGPASSQEILENIWAGYTEDEKVPVIGGNMGSIVENAPGNFDMAYAEEMTYMLLVPADQLMSVTDAASMVHMMNANTFTAGVFHMAEDVITEEFAAAMQNSVQNNQWVCGFPETLVIATVGNEYVVMAFGVNDTITSFRNHLTEAYPEAVILYNEAIK